MIAARTAALANVRERVRLALVVAALVSGGAGCGDTRDDSDTAPVDASDAADSNDSDTSGDTRPAADDTPHALDDSSRLDTPDLPRDVDEGAFDPTLDGPWSVGHHTVEFGVAGRNIAVELWYPATGVNGARTPMVDFALDAPQAATLDGLLAAAPTGCPTETVGSTRGAPPATGIEAPLIVVSHCHECSRFSMASVAERLASHGAVVAAPEHVGNSLWDGLAGEGLPLDVDTLALRVADLTATFDLFLGADPPIDADDLFDAARAQVDRSRVGLIGHSFGAVTVGVVAQHDARVGAVAAYAAPMENPLLPGVDVAQIAIPSMFVVAVEDNSISEFGNQLMRRNFARVGGESWKVEIADAGHWSFSDLCGLIEAFQAGCGEGRRQTNNAAFGYLPPTEGRALAAAWATTFFAATLSDNAAARGWAGAHDALSVEIAGPDR